MILTCLKAWEVPLLFCNARFRAGIFSNQLDKIVEQRMSMQSNLLFQA
jgi:hypothetical protein